MLLAVEPKEQAEKEEPNKLLEDATDEDDAEDDVARLKGCLFRLPTNQLLQGAASGLCSKRKA